MYYITDNKHAWNQRRQLELHKEIDELITKYETTKGFFKRLRLRNKIDRLNSENYKRGSEIMEYERRKAVTVNESKN